MSIPESIIQRYIDGDNQAVAELYTCLKDRFLLLAYNITRNKEASRDTVQDVFEKMMSLPVEKRKECFGEENTNIEAWLYVAVKNKCLDMQRIKTSREKIILSVRHLFNTNTNNHSQERFCQDGLREMLKQLQPKEQEIILLHLDGYTNEEISTRLNITYNTVKNNIYESRKKMKKLWDLFMN